MINIKNNLIRNYLLFSLLIDNTQKSLIKDYFDSDYTTQDCRFYTRLDLSENDNCFDAKLNQEITSWTLLDSLTECKKNLVQDSLRINVSSGTENISKPGLDKPSASNFFDDEFPDYTDVTPVTIYDYPIVSPKSTGNGTLSIATPEYKSGIFPQLENLLFKDLYVTREGGVPFEYTLRSDVYHHTDKVLSGRTKRYRIKKRRDKLSNVKTPIISSKTVAKSDYFMLIDNLRNNFKEISCIGLGVDKISMHFPARLLNESNYKQFNKKGPISVNKCGTYGYIHIHYELLTKSLFMSIRDVVLFCIEYLVLRDVLNLDSEITESYVYNNFGLSEIEVKFDFDENHSIMDLVRGHSTFLKWEKGTRYSKLDYKKKLIDEVTRAILKKGQKSLLCIYPRSVKTGDGVNVQRFELRLTGKYIKQGSYKLTLESIFNETVVYLPYKLKNHLALALRQCISENIFQKVLALVSDKPEYSLLKYVLLYAYPFEEVKKLPELFSSNDLIKQFNCSDHK